MRGPHFCRNSFWFHWTRRLSEQLDHPFHSPIGQRLLLLDPLLEQLCVGGTLRRGVLDQRDAPIAGRWMSSAKSGRKRSAFFPPSRVGVAGFVMKIRAGVHRRDLSLRNGDLRQIRDPPCEGRICGLRVKDAGK